MKRLVSVLTILAALVFALTVAEAGLKKSDSEVKIVADASKPDSAGKQTVTVTIDINPGWYIYANPVDNKDFESNRTEIKVLAGKKDLEATVEYPKGTPKSLGDIKYSVYTGKATFKASITRPADAKELTVSVRINTCNDKGLCLAPATVKIPVP